MLRELALHYVGRFATTRTKLERYLTRKIRERGWDGPDPSDAPSRVAEQLATLGYVDDAAWAGMTARSLSRRGYGGRRVDQSLWAAGVDDSARSESRVIVAEAWLESALRLAERRRWGPFAVEPDDGDRRRRERQVAAFVRAGHDARLARRILALAPGADISELADDLAAHRIEDS